ncbi:FtsQ-type POTRA domain-containing protein [Dictyobacter kobayashii]|uniref:UDP-N-acetylenolpyruvoylglucosamine reductase n=1 Tax=Dictyobacter kobayashii TaxID=2014872 RepID=A0A402AG81_9CHLR|nr:FtsQ-type POTRA domain-containing protein [Dictyobacter kobayashii]GCE18102.1 hypothetical protein KDK_19020 [Dictyobacter kobayashii]
MQLGIRLHREDPQKLREAIDEHKQYRKRTQPPQQSAGSVFKNPQGDFSGRLIEAVGLKGTVHGGAQISERHANFIVNVGGARAADVAALIKEAHQRVYDRFGIDLELEVELRGSGRYYDMTERKKLPQQRATSSYNKLEKVYTPRDALKREPDSGMLVSSRSLKRVVTVPDADPSVAWHTFDQRQTQRRRVRSRVQKPVKLVPRTLVQTGVRATSGRIHAVRRPLPYKSSIPRRSGRRHGRRSMVWKIAAVFVIIACIIALINFILTSDTFRLHRVNIVGTRNAKLIQSIQHMDIQGQNIFLIDTGNIQARIQASPLVASVEMSKQFPDQLTVTIVERKAAVLWQSPQGTFSVDKQGMVIAPASQTPDSEQLGTVVDTTRRSAKTEPSLRPGTYLKNIDIEFASNVWQQVPKVAGIDTFKLYYDGTMYASTTSQSGGMVDSRGSYIIESPDGWKAYLGSSQDANSLENRLKELSEIVKLARQQQMNIATIDLRYGLRPVFTLQQ